MNNAWFYCNAAPHACSGSMLTNQLTSTPFKSALTASLRIGHQQYLGSVIAVSSGIHLGTMRLCMTKKICRHPFISPYHSATMRPSMRRALHTVSAMSNIPPPTIDIMAIPQHGAFWLFSGDFQIDRHDT